jgi:hypothetical protein
MKRQTLPPPNPNDWDQLPIDVQIYIAWRIFVTADLPRLIESTLSFLNRVDLWLFPPSVFYSVYLTTMKNFPPHPIKIFAVLATAFMSATLTLFLIRPTKHKPAPLLKESHD